MIAINEMLTLESLGPQLSNFWEHSGVKIKAIADEYDHAQGSPVFTAGGKYTTRGWTEWTQGFEYGSSILQFDATNDPWFLEYGQVNTVEKMAPACRKRCSSLLSATTPQWSSPSRAAPRRPRHRGRRR